MPAGVTWGVYIRFSAAAFLSMMAGSQLVHTIFQPLAVSTPLQMDKSSLIFYWE